MNWIEGCQLPGPEGSLGPVGPDKAHTFFTLEPTVEGGLSLETTAHYGPSVRWLRGWDGNKVLSKYFLFYIYISTNKFFTFFFSF